MRTGAALIVLVAAATLVVAAHLWPAGFGRTVAGIDGTAVAMAHRLALAACGVSASAVMPERALHLVEALVAPLPFAGAVILLCLVLARWSVGWAVLGMALAMGLCEIGELQPEVASALAFGAFGVGAVWALGPRGAQAAVAAAVAEMVIVAEMQRYFAWVEAGGLALSGRWETDGPLAVSLLSASVAAWIGWQALKLAYAQVRLDWLDGRKGAERELWRASPCVASALED